MSMVHPPRWLSPSSCSRSIHTSSLAIGKLLNTPSEIIPQPENIKIEGRVRSVRHQKARAFVSIGDGSSIEPLQAIMTPTQAESLSTGTGVRLYGSWTASPNPTAQSHELHVKSIDAVAPVDPTKYKLQKKHHTAEYLRTIPHLRMRTPHNSLLLRFRSICRARLGHDLTRHGYTHIDTPTLTSSDCEAGGETFLVTTEETKNGEETFFKATKYLTVSAQLHLEAAAQGLHKVWTLSNTFRAEKSDTSRHLSEFKMLEAEITFVKSLRNVTNSVEFLLRGLVLGFYGNRTTRELIHGARPVPADDGDRVKEELERPDLLEKRWQGMMKKHWPVVTYTKAIELLKSASRDFEHKPTWGASLKAEHEDFIARTVGQGSPVFVTHYPKAIKPFYMLSSTTPSADGDTVECFDLLVPDICEIAGGSLREHALEPLIENMQQKKMVQQGSDLTAKDFGNLDWYVELRTQGYIPSGGYGIGFDRLIMYLSGVNNIREVVTFPSWAGH